MYYTWPFGNSLAATWFVVNDYDPQYEARAHVPFAINLYVALQTGKQKK